MLFGIHSIQASFSYWNEVQSCLSSTLNHSQPHPFKEEAGCLAFSFPQLPGPEYQNAEADRPLIPRCPLQLCWGVLVSAGAVLLDCGLCFCCLFTLKTLQDKGPFGTESETERGEQREGELGTWSSPKLREDKMPRARSWLTSPLFSRSPFSLLHLISGEWIPRTKSGN